MKREVEIVCTTNDIITFRIGRKEMLVSKEDWKRLQQFFKERREHFGRDFVDTFLNPPEKSYQELKEYFKEEKGD